MLIAFGSLITDDINLTQVTQEGIENATQACESGDKDVCIVLANYYFAQRDSSKVAKLAHKGLR